MRVSARHGAAACTQGRRYVRVFSARVIFQLLREPCACAVCSFAGLMKREVDMVLCGLRGSAFSDVRYGIEL